MKRRNIALIIGVAALTLSACNNNTAPVPDTETKEVIQFGDAATEAPEIADNTEAVTETVGGTESTEVTGQDNSTESEKTYDEITVDGEVEKFDSVVMINDSGYEYYSYKEAPAKKYSEAVTKFADSTDVNVYDIVIPLGSGIVFPDNLKDQSPSEDQKFAIDSILGMMGDSVKTVNIYDSLMSHRTEYVYFRTDHHWTQLGAYYAYEDFCETKGIKANPLDGYETVTYEGFLGSFYKDTNEAKSMEDNEDTITVYKPKASSTSMHVTPAEGDEYDWNVINDVSDYSAGIKYSTFVAGDNPISVIKNKDLSDGSTCIIVKESYGNAFTPFLVDHYENIYLVDYRYWDGKVSDLVKETGATDVILLNNLTMIKNNFQIGQLQGVLQ